MGNQLCNQRDTDFSNYGLPTFNPIRRGDPQWMPSAKRCRECGARFGFFVLKNHCEACGSIFCGRCCYRREILRDHFGCGMCVAEASVMIRQLYETKRSRQIRAHSERYHSSKSLKELPVPPCEVEKEKEKEKEKESEAVERRTSENATVKAQQPKQCDHVALKVKDAETEEKEEKQSAVSSSNKNSADAPEHPPSAPLSAPEAVKDAAGKDEDGHRGAAEKSAKASADAARADDEVPNN